MTNHSVINASGTTHAKIAFLAVAVSAVFVAVVSATSGIRSDVAGSRNLGPVVKATTATVLAASDRASVR